MKALREAGVIRNEPNGRRRTLTLRRDDLDALFPGLLGSVLTAWPRAPQLSLVRDQYAASNGPGT